MPAAPTFWRDAALPFVELRRADGSRACYRAHSHATWSIGAVDAGRSVFSACGRQQRALREGNVVVVPAGCVHACNPAPGTAWSYQMLHMAADWLDATLPAGQAKTLRQGAWVLRDAGLYRDFCALGDTLFSHACTADKRAALMRFVRGLALPAAGATLPAAPVREAAAVAQLRACIDADPAARTPLAVLAQRLGVPPRRLAAAFRAATGLTPHAYRIDARVRLARQLLGAGNAVASVAHDTGFFDQAHLGNAFRQRVAATPGAYQRPA